MAEPDQTNIGGSKTCGDWRSFRGNLVPGGDQAPWEAAIADYFLPRIQFRYFDPIKVLQELGTNQGEGFSIAAIHCTLIEFLESTVQGINYRWVQRDADLGLHEYRKSAPVFVAFLTNREPFRQCFTTEALGLEFYKNIRCSLLHEARTKGGWRIRANGPSDMIANTDDRILYRNEFHKAVLRFIEWYRVAIVSEVNLQEAFLRKFNDICE